MSYDVISIDQFLFFFLHSTCDYSQASVCKFIKKRLWHRCFPVKFAKFLRIPFLQNTSGWLLLSTRIQGFIWALCFGIYKLPLQKYVEIWLRENPYSGIFYAVYNLYIPMHCVKSIRIRRFSGPHFPAFGLNMDQENSDYRHFSYSDIQTVYLILK